MKTKKIISALKEGTFIQKSVNYLKRKVYSHLPIKNNKVVLVNFAGKGYGDNPKAIADEILKRSYGWDLVWVTQNIFQEFPKGIRVVEYDSIEAYKELTTARLWIFNIRNFPHPPKRKGQIYLQTWHGGGILLKRIEGMAQDILSPQYIASAKEDGLICDYILSSDNIRTEILRQYFWLGDNVKILEFGTPKDDIFFDERYQKTTAEKIRNLLGIGAETIIILYMPTFRDSEKAGFEQLDYQRIVDAFESKFNKKAVLVLRFHPNVRFKKTDYRNSNNIVDLTPYPDANDLLVACDFCIGDYTSSSIFRPPILGKVSFLYTPDYENYKNTRGLTEYYDLIPMKKAFTNDELIDIINEFDLEDYSERWKRFFSENPSYDDGNATDRVVNFLHGLLNDDR